MAQARGRNGCDRRIAAGGWPWRNPNGHYLGYDDYSSYSWGVSFGYPSPYWHGYGYYPPFAPGYPYGYGQPLPAYGTACLQADGSWKIVSGPFAVD